MPQRLSLATVAACAVLAAVVFGGAYALAHDEPAAAPAPTPASPTAIRLEDHPIGTLHRVRPVPALVVPPPPRTEPTEPEPADEDQSPVVTTPEPVAPVVTPPPAPDPTPTPNPTPAPKPRKPLTFDDSG